MCMNTELRISTGECAHILVHTYTLTHKYEKKKMTVETKAKSSSSAPLMTAVFIKALPPSSLLEMLTHSSLEEPRIFT